MADTLLKVIDHNFNQHACRIPAVSKGMVVRELDHLTYTDSGLPCDTFNIIHILNGDDLREEELIEALAHFKSRDFPFCLWINDKNLTTDVTTLLTRHSLVPQNEEIAMVMDLDQYSPITLEEDSSIRTIDTPEMIAEYAEIIAKNWSPPDKEVLNYYQSTKHHYLTDKNIRLFIYYIEGKPVATLEMFTSNDSVVGFYSLATLKDYRGKGIGSAMMTFALNMAKSLGYKTAVLQASEDGLGIYTKSGFKNQGRYVEFAVG